MNSIDLKENLKKFVKEIMWTGEGWCDTVDGDTLQDIAEKRGLIELVEQKQPCCPECACRHMMGPEAFPLMCYRWTEGME